MADTYVITDRDQRAMNSAIVAYAMLTRNQMTKLKDSLKYNVDIISVFREIIPNVDNDSLSNVIKTFFLDFFNRLNWDGSLKQLHSIVSGIADTVPITVSHAMRIYKIVHDEILMLPNAPDLPPDADTRSPPLLINDSRVGNHGPHFRPWSQSKIKMAYGNQDPLQPQPQPVAAAAAVPVAAGSSCGPGGCSVMGGRRSRRAHRTKKTKRRQHRAMRTKRLR